MKSKKETGKRKKGSGTALLLFTFAFLIFTSSCGSSSGAVPAGATMGTCPVCQMKVKASDDWAAEIYFKDGTKFMFESPGDMLAFYTSPDRYTVGELHKDRASIEKINVKDYESKQAIDAREATLVFGSEIEGPMGPDFLPFGKHKNAEEFVSANGGTLLYLSNVTEGMTRDLRK